MLSQTSLTRGQRIEAEPGRIVTYARTITVGRGEAEDADLPTQQNCQDRESDITAQPALPGSTR